MPPFCEHQRRVFSRGDAGHFRYRASFDPIWITLGVAGLVRYGCGGHLGPPDPQ